MELIVRRLFVDSWKTNISYHAYYTQCAPLTCTYEYSGQNNLFFVIITIIAVFGGLSLGFKILILIIVRFVEKMINNFSYHGFQVMIKDLFICRTENRRIARLHFILLVITLGVNFGSSVFTLQPTAVEIIKPSLSTYQHLATHFPNSLRCTCSHLSIRYQSFVNITPYFHQICTSNFVSDSWIKHQYDRIDLLVPFPPTDFRASATSQYQLLASLCELSQKIIHDSLLELMSNDLINTQLLSSDLLDQQLQMIIDEFQSAILTNFLSKFNLIREMTSVNQIMSILYTNFKFISDPVIYAAWQVHTETAVYGECDCGLSRKCTQPSEGKMVGCYPIEALLQSTLGCFYDQQCIDPDGNFSTLNISSSEITRFNMNSTIEMMLNQLMIEQYSTNISYQNYFDQCATSSCTYSYVGYQSVTDAITSLISLYGGLTIITNCISVIITKLCFQKTNRIDTHITA